jgi:Ca2+-binding RTX toxin-like protein
MGRTAGKLALLPALLLLALLVGTADHAVAAPAPSCAEGPVRVGDTIRGTACDDKIVVPASVALVEAGAGDDTIRAAPLATSASCPSECRLGVGSQTFDGGPGDDVVFGERGNDILNGGEGNDRLFGGIGDDLLRGGPGNDRLAGGLGFDSIDGEAGDDFVRGDGTIDRIFDSGGGADTLSYATGITPGFGGTVGVSGFPAASGERGVRLELGIPGQNGNNGIASLGGGVDEVEVGQFETVIGTPFSDLIVGTPAAEAIYGGGGADVLLGEGGADTLNGGADGDNVDGAVDTRDSAKISVGFMAPGLPGPAAVYVTGSGAGDTITAAYSPSAVVFTLSGSTFDDDPAAAAGCTLDPIPNPTTATCPLPAAGLDSVVLAGMGGDDDLSAGAFPTTTSVVVLGGDGADELNGGEASEDVLVDGPDAGNDLLSALGGDDALLHNGGDDELIGGNGNDLFLSASTCDGQVLNGGPGRDNGSWARLKDEGVAATLAGGQAGEVGPGVTPVCPGDNFDTLAGIEDLEGSEAGDVFLGDTGPNQLLGHKGPDLYAAGAGDDSVLANSADLPKFPDSDLAIDCGEGIDSALIDFHPQSNDPAPVNCESVREAEGNNFRTVTELPPPPLPEPPPPRPVDRKAPRTRITHRPPKLVVARGLPRRVSFRFASTEPGSSFRCKLDATPFRACAPPRAYKVGSGSHAFRVFAIDKAGNRDASPALFVFQVRRR